MNKQRPYARLPLLMVFMTITALTIGGTALYTIQRHLIERAGANLAVQAAEIADQLDQVLFERYGDIQVAAAALPSRMGDPAALDRYLHSLEDQYVVYRWLAVTDADGRIIAATNASDVGADRSRETWFQFVRSERAVHLKNVMESELDRGGLTVGFSAPILGERGEFLGVVTSRVGLDRLEDVFTRPVVSRRAQEEGLAGTIEWQLLNREGALISDSILRDGGETNLRERGLPSALLSTSGEPGYVEEQHLRRGVSVVTGYASTAGYAEFPGFGWRLLIRMDRADVLAPINRVLWKFAAVGAGIWGPMFLFLVWASQRVHREWTTAHQRGQWLSAVLISIGDGVIVTDADGHVTFMNSVAKVLTGWELEEAAGRKLDEVFVIVNESTRRPVESPVGKVLREGKVVGLANHTVLLSRDGREYPIDDSGAPIHTATGDVTGVVLVFRDITETKDRKRVETALQESESRFRSLVGSATDAIIVADSHGQVLSWNQAAQQHFGYHEQDVVGQPLTVLMPARYREAHRRGLDRIAATGQSRLAGQTTELYGLRKDGTEFPLECSFATWQAGGEVFFSGILRDISARKRAEQRLRAEHAVASLLAEAPSQKVAPAILRTIGESLGWDLGILWRVDRRANVLRAVECWCAPGVTSGSFESASRGMTFAPGVGLPGRVWASGSADWIPSLQDDANFPRAALAREAGLSAAVGFPIVCGSAIMGVMEFFSREIRPPDEELLEMMTAVGRQIGLFLDRAQIQEQLNQAQKMDAVGKLAGGIAHDFNNLLTVITGYTDLILRRRNLDTAFACQIEEIRKAAERAAALTQQLLAFSRRQMLEIKTVNVNQLVNNMETMLRRLIGEHIQLVSVLPPGIGMVKADPGQLEQVLVNLVVNARDAMLDGGTLTIETANVELDALYASQHDNVIPGPYVMLAVSDTGHGMSPETQGRIFEPFFTTKPPGKGTGLGLATVHGIITQSKGTIWLYSEPGRGTTFKIYLPTCEGVEQATGPARPKPAAPSGSETVLLVEDEEGVRQLVREVLTMRGYTVLSAANGEAALQLCTQHRGPIHLLMTDVVMPGMSGRQLVERLQKDHPEIKILYMSGYTDNAIVHQGIVDEGTAFLQKPFSPDALAFKVREVLDGP